jgi:hypothetical protein
VPPVTEPAQYIAELRRTYGWPPNQPVYGCDGGVLRLWTENGQWFLDNRLVGPMAACDPTFVWCFETLEEAIAGVLRFFAATRYFASRLVYQSWPGHS